MCLGTSGATGKRHDFGRNAVVRWQMAKHALLRPFISYAREAVTCSSAKTIWNAFLGWAFPRRQRKARLAERGGRDVAIIFSVAVLCLARQRGTPGRSPGPAMAFYDLDGKTRRAVALNELVMALGVETIEHEENYGCGLCRTVEAVGR
ncbi:MAG: hypothetical protein ABSG53_16365 [Thermoguttaceae bacterium]